MFAHIYRNRIKVSIRDRQMLFWTFLFPIILATFFNMAFSNLSANETFQTIPVAVVKNAAYEDDQTLKDVLKSVSEPDLQNPDQAVLFQIDYLSQDQAAAALTDKKIAGYLIPGDPMTVVVASSGIRQTILKIFVDDYLQTRAAMEQILQQDPSLLPVLAEKAAERVSVIRDKPVSSVEADTVLTYFYALIAMTCLYGGFWGLKEVISIQANQSNQAARLNVTPVHKMKIFGYSLLAALTVHYASLLVLIAYLRFALGIEFGRQLGYVLLAALSGSLLGVSFGGFIAAVLKCSENIKYPLLIGFSMVCSFLSGLMIVDIKYITVKAFPAISWINPANLISDAFYALYYYETPGRTLLNISLQLGLAAVLFGIIALVVRRQRYASL